MRLKQQLYCETIGCRMAYVVKEILQTLRDRFRKDEVELTIEQFFILNILDNEDGLILQELAEILERDKSAVLRHIDGLEENHFVTRVTDSRDKRRKLLLVTKPGIETLQKARAIDVEINEMVQGQLSKAGTEQFDEGLSQIYKFLNSYNS